MSAVRLLDVAFAYRDAPPLFSHVTLDLPLGWSAIAGPNGSGKTTLLRLIGAELSPTEGRVLTGSLAIATVRQAPRSVPEEVEQLGSSWDARATRLRARFGLHVEQLARWGSLCGGERQRWQIASAMAREPDVLLLDEPTNHLDAEGRRQLARMLEGFRGVGVVVAHDRAFLDSLVERVVWVERGAVRRLDGTYSDARAVFDEERARREKARADRRAEERRLRTELTARRARESSAARNVSARTRMKSVLDSDGRSVGRKVRAASAAQKHARAAKRMERRVAGAVARLAEVRTSRDRYRAITIEGERSEKSDVLRLTLPELTGGGRTLLAQTVVRLGRDARVRLAGANGAGKTTLLEAIVEAWPHPRERLLYLPQRALDGAALLERVESAPPEQRGRALSLCSALGLDVVRLRASRDPSPGEARKLALAEGLARRVYCAVLDEPESHLDAPSVERLEAALGAYSAALLVVTHDDALAAAVTDVTWTLTDGELR